MARANRPIWTHHENCASASSTLNPSGSELCGNRSSVIPGAARLGNVERMPLRGTEPKGALKGALKPSLDIEQLRRELEMQTPFRANTPGKPSERDRREMEEAVAAYNFAVRRAAERGRCTSDAEGKE